MTDILALYRGQTVAEARLVAVTVDRDVVRRFAKELVGEAGVSVETDETGERSEPEKLRLVADDEE
jgi:hypothetical protein